MIYSSDEENEQDGSDAADEGDEETTVETTDTVADEEAVPAVDDVEDEVPADEGAEPKADDLKEVEKASYRITGLVDIFDEQSIITGQYEIGSTQELPVAQGDAAVADGRAEKVE